MEILLNRIQLSELDLNLLLTLSVLLEEESVTVAAARLGRTPSAVSHALGRLRELFKDPLLVRAGQRLRPTPAAEALRAPLSLLVEQAVALMQGRAFDPSRERYCFRVLASDYLQRVLLLPALSWIRAAPAVDLRVSGVPANLELALGQDGYDLALGVSLSAPDALLSRALTSDRFVCMIRDDGREIPRDVEGWAACPHLLVTPSGRSSRGPVDDALERAGLRRRIVLTLPGFLAAVEAVAGSDLLLTLPERMARHLRPPGTRLFAPPLPLPTYRLLLLWHPRADADPRNRWLRDCFSRISFPPLLDEPPCL